MHAHQVNSYAMELYPTYGALFGVSCVQCMFMTVFVFWLVASQSICQPSFVLSRNTACASKILKPKLCQMSPLYLPIYGIAMPFQVNLRVPTLNFKILFLFCVPVPLMKRKGVANIFHARCVILTMSVYSLVIAQECGGNRDAQSRNVK